MRNVINGRKKGITNRGRTPSRRSTDGRRIYCLPESLKTKNAYGVSISWWREELIRVMSGKAKSLPLQEILPP